MFSTVVLLALASVALAGHRDNHERRSSSSSQTAELDREAAVKLADDLIAAAQAQDAQAALDAIAEPSDGLSGVRVLSSSWSSSSSSASSSESTESSTAGSSTEISTSDLLNVAAEEFLIERAIQAALETEAPAKPVQKKAYQARFEITAFDGERFKTEELSFGPTVISTRRNFFLANTNNQFWTMFDYLDAGFNPVAVPNGVPDVVETLQTFRSTANPAAYINLLKNRASSSVARLTSRDAGVASASIDLVNLIRLDGRFSLTNHLLSPCFSVTDEEEFVFEALVGLPASEFNDGARLSAAPNQTSNVLLGATTAHADNDPSEPNTDRNLFYDGTAFAESVTVPLWLNTVPNLAEPGTDDPAIQGTVHLSACASFSYFN